MGQTKSQFSDEELNEYEDLTYFTKKEILVAHRKFKSLAPEKVGHNKNAKLSMSKILQYPELKVNPFGDRICKVSKKCFSLARFSSHYSSSLILRFSVLTTQVTVPLKIFSI